MIAFTSACLVHRAELMQLRGAWTEATEEARRARGRQSPRTAQAAHAAAYYRQAEIDRLRGDSEAAEAAYLNASREGFDPQPGLALLRLSQGRRDAAGAALRRALEAAVGPLERARLLPAYTETAIALDDRENARIASRELADIAARFDTDVLRAMSAQAAGTVKLAEGNASDALASLGKAFDAWRKLGAPYEAAQIRLLKGLACRECGDIEGATLELEAARATFGELGAASDLARVEGYLRIGDKAGNHSLTPRELQVLRLIASGKTNKAIAEELSLSEKTVDRHASNIFNKIDVPSRTAATAFAFKHSLI
jgi:DNA-binding CsgD family transcriptional regulator